MQGVLNERDNTLRTIRFGEPEWIPCVVALSPGIWNRHREALEEVVAEHPSIFPDGEGQHRDYDEFPREFRAGEEWTDSWGSVWENVSDGICGQPKTHPLQDWSALEAFRAPVPFDGADIGKLQKNTERRRSEGKMTWGGSDRFYERLMFLRGYRNLMMDFLRDPPELRELCDIIVEHNIGEIRAWLEIGVDGMRWGDDLGAQERPMMSPANFERHLYPGYSRMCRLAKEAGCETYMHSDGRILELMDLLAKAGFTILNPQVTINPIDILSRRYRGRLCLDADVDRQHILPRGKPRQVRAHIEEIVTKLGCREGGLMIIAGVYPDVPLENIKALCDAMDEFRYHYA